MCVPSHMKSILFGGGRGLPRSGRNRCGIRIASANSRKPGALAICKVCTTEGYVCEDDGRTLLSSDVSFPIDLGVSQTAATNG